MEENKNQEKSESHNGQKCHGFHCPCGSAGHKVVKLILVIVMIVVLLSIGAAFGARRAERFNGFDRRDGFGCRFQNDWQTNEGRNERQFNMMRGNQGNWSREENSPIGVPPTPSQITPTGTSTPNLQ